MRIGELIVILSLTEKQGKPINSSVGDRLLFCNELTILIRTIEPFNNEKSTIFE